MVWTLAYDGINFFCSKALLSQTAAHTVKYEAPRLIKSIGTRPAVILRNHGLLAWGASLPLTFSILWTLQRACEIQVATASMGTRIMVSEEIARSATKDSFQFSPTNGEGQDLFDALVRQVDKIDNNYKS